MEGSVIYPKLESLGVYRISAQLFSHGAIGGPFGIGTRLTVSGGLAYVSRFGVGTPPRVETQGGPAVTVCAAAP